MMTELCGIDLNFKRGQWCELPAGHEGQCSGREFNWMIGDQVEKISGYRWPGQVVSVFTTSKGLKRVVVECLVEEVSGALHIYSPEQLFRTGRTEA